MENYLLVDINPPIATLTLNRPNVRNAFNEEVIQTITEQLILIKTDPNIQVLILQGTGDHFCAGGDIQWMKKMSKASKEENREDALKLSRMLYELNHLPIPTICLVQGSVYGGGIGLVAASDIVLADNTAVFCFSEVKLGIIPALVSPYVFRAMGLKNLSRYMLTAEPFNATEAFRMGLIHQVTTPETLKSTSEALINRLLQNAPNAVQLCKRLLQTLSEEPTPMGKMDWTAELLTEVRSLDEAKEGFAAFLEKRTPNWYP